MRLGSRTVFRFCGVGVLAVILAACNAPQDSALEGGATYRNQDTLIGVTSRFDEESFSGIWYLRGYLPETENFDQLAFRIETAGPQFRIAANVCDQAGICGVFAEDLKTRRLGQGRYVIKTLDGVDRRLWVLWIDEGFRTAVIGNPEGTFAWIVDRSQKGGTDRITAAREILDFNGYDVSQLKVKK